MYPPLLVFLDIFVFPLAGVVHGAMAMLREGEMRAAVSFYRMMVRVSREMLPEIYASRQCCPIPVSANQ